MAELSYEEMVKAYGKKAADEFFAAASVPQRGGAKATRRQPAVAEEVQIQEFMPAPNNRSVGGTRGKYESPAEFKFRMNQGIPRGARSGAGGGLDQMLLMNEGGMGAEDARLKANILRSQGGRVSRGKDGGLTMQSATARNAPRSSTGRDYDPVAERKAMLANAKAAVDERKNLQASDAILLRKQEEAARTPGTMRGFANQYGSGQAKTNTLDEFLKRPAAKITEGRHNPVTNDMREVIGWMNKDQAAAGMPSLDSARILKEGDAMTKAYDLNQKNKLAQATRAFAGRGMA